MVVGLTLMSYSQFLVECVVKQTVGDNIKTLSHSL